MAKTYPRIGHFHTAQQFAEHLGNLAPDFPLDDQVLSAAEGSPLAEPLQIGPYSVGNRWCVHPMEGWDASDDGRPTEHVVRRWRHFGQSGAKLIWGGEAYAVRRDGRANPNQLYYSPENVEPTRRLLGSLLGSHAERFGQSALGNLIVGLQLTHSGRFCRPNRKDRPEPRIAYHHPVLDAKFGIDPDDSAVVFSDDELKRLVDDYVTVARMAHRIGFQFVDVKHCHGYLGHELLSAVTRPGPYGGSLENRSRFLREIVEAVRVECPGLLIGVRLSLFDGPAFRPDPALTGGGKFGPGIPHEYTTPYPAFGCDPKDPMVIDLTEPIELLRFMRDTLKVDLVNLTAGSPYYNPHLQRPAFYPPSDAYQPPEDPLLGCIRQIQAVRQAKQAVPGLPIVGTAYTYFQDYLPNVAQAVVRQGWVDSVGIGRMILSYWGLPTDMLEGHPLKTNQICRTFSDCTTGPRNGLISGCYPLDSYYKTSLEGERLKEAKRRLREQWTSSD